MKGKVLVQDANLYSDMEFDAETKTFTLLVDVHPFPLFIFYSSGLHDNKKPFRNRYLPVLLSSLPPNYPESFSPNLHRSPTKPSSISTSTTLLSYPPSPRSPRSLSPSSPPPTLSSRPAFSARSPSSSSLLRRLWKD